MCVLRVCVCVVCVCYQLSAAAGHIGSQHPSSFNLIHLFMFLSVFPEKPRLLQTRISLQRLVWCLMAEAGVGDVCTRVHE